MIDVVFLSSFASNLSFSCSSTTTQQQPPTHNSHSYLLLIQCTSHHVTLILMLTPYIHTTTVNTAHPFFLPLLAFPPSSYPAAPHFNFIIAIKSPLNPSIYSNMAFRLSLSRRLLAPLLLVACSSRITHAFLLPTPPPASSSLSRRAPTTTTTTTTTTPTYITTSTTLSARRRRKGDSDADFERFGKWRGYTHTHTHT